MLVLGTVVLMPGIGFILSAGITWVTGRAARPDAAESRGAGHSDSPYSSARERAVSRRQSNEGEEAAAHALGTAMPNVLAGDASGVVCSPMDNASGP